ncbi:MAG: aldo/keto reductase, partial [Candidatus Hodarchaeales archaeon]
DDPVPNKGGLSRFHIFRAIEASLKRLQLDYIDLYQIHSFWSLDKRPLPALEELLRTFNHLIDQGKVLHVGANNMRAWLFAKSFWMAERYGLEPFSTMQNHYNLVFREEEREMLPLCEDQQVGVLPWSPLARGFLSGKYKRTEGPQSSDSTRGKTDQMMTRRYFRPEDFDVVDRVVELAEEKDVTPAQIALAWLLNKPVAS